MMWKILRKIPKTPSSRTVDPFYDSLEGSLSDLKAVTVVRRVEPLALPLIVSLLKLDFEYRIIGMLRHISNLYSKREYRIAKHSMSKREFKDDLDLILYI